MSNIFAELSNFNRITFFEDTHTYKIANQASISPSVTTFIEKYKQPFEKEKWAQIKAQKYGMTPTEVLSMWDLNRIYSATQGTVVHSYIENFYNGKIKNYDQNFILSRISVEDEQRLRVAYPEFIKQFILFYQNNRHLIPVKTELIVGDMDCTHICGMVDLLVFNTINETYEIYDFKTSKTINIKSRYDKKMLQPISFLDDCEFNHYALQLSFYRYFIEKYTQIKISEQKIVWLKPSTNSYELINLPYYSEEVGLLLNDFIKNKITI
jgi:hypothetical protein